MLGTEGFSFGICHIDVMIMEQSRISIEGKKIHQSKFNDNCLSTIPKHPVISKVLSTIRKSGCVLISNKL